MAQPFVPTSSSRSAPRPPGERPRVVVVGGGLAGLIAAARLGRTGRAHVTLLDGARTLGGRARTTDRHGFKMNLGPHALYCSGQALEELKALEIRPLGARPPVSGVAVFEPIRQAGGMSPPRFEVLPSGPAAILRSRALTWTGRWQLARLFTQLPRLDTTELDAVPFHEWIAGFEPSAARVISAFVRLSTYANSPELSTGLALAQLRLGLDGVLYLDGGWQQVVDALVARLTDAGVDVQTRAAVQAVVPGSRGEFEVTLRDGRHLHADAVVLATTPDVVSQLVDVPWVTTGPVVRAACLDVGLRRLPRPRPRFALGIDEPTYASVHSGIATLAPDGGAMVHVARYLDPEARSRVDHQPQLASLLAAMQPGYEQEVVDSRYLPSLAVTHDLAPASTGGLSGRTPVQCPGVPGLMAAGDWVGDTGWLADAAAASARSAADGVLNFLDALQPRALEVAC